MDFAEYEKKLLALPEAGKISSEHDEHDPTSPEFVQGPHGYPKCMCNRCRIIRIKKRLSFRFPRSKCRVCGELFISLFHDTCAECRD